jgi:hypothetical protein
VQPPAREIPPAPAHPAAPVPAPVSKSVAIFQQGSHEVDPHTGSSPSARDGRRGARAWASVAVLSRRLSGPTSLQGIVASGPCLCGTAALIISPVSWAHHYVWVVPVLAWLLLGDDRPNGGPWWALGAAALFWAAPVWWPSDVQSGYGGPLVLLTGNSFFLAASAFLVLTAVLLISRHRSRPRPTSRS